MQNKIQNFLLILGLFLLGKFLLIPILLLVEMINIKILSDIFIFIFDYGLFGIAFFFGFCNLFLTKFERAISRINSNLSRLGLYFMVSGWIPIALVLNHEFNRYVVQAVLVSVIVGVIFDNKIFLIKKVVLITIFLLIFALLFIGNSVYGFDA